LTSDSAASDNRPTEPVGSQAVLFGDWPIRHGHDLVEQIAADLRQELPHAVVSTHLEPQEPVAQHSGGQ
jgi:hypothetical protein